jgi:hypothetical protein
MKAEEKQKKRELAIAESLLASKIPFTTEHKSKKEEKMAKMRSEIDKENSFAPKIVKEVPNFGEKQEKFAQELEKKKVEQPKTVLSDFKLSEGRAKPGVDAGPTQEDYLKAQEQKKINAERINAQMLKMTASIADKEADGKKKKADIEAKKEADKAQMLENKKKAMKAVGSKNIVSGLLGGLGAKKPAPPNLNGGGGLFATEDVEGGDQGLPGGGLFAMEDVEGGDQGLPGGGLFAMEDVEGGDQGLPGGEPTPAEPPAPAILFDGKKPKAEPKKVDLEETKNYQTKGMQIANEKKLQAQKDKRKQDKGANKEAELKELRRKEAAKKMGAILKTTKPEPKATLSPPQANNHQYSERMSAMQ